MNDVQTSSTAKLFTAAGTPFRPATWEDDMGWQSDDGVHEGYIAGLVAFRARGRLFLRQPTWDVDEAMFANTDELPVDAIQVTCTCGWRSQCFRAPPGLTHCQWIVLGVPAAVEDQACALWESHLQASPPSGWTPFRREDWWLSVGEKPTLTNGHRPANAQ